MHAYAIKNVTTGEYLTTATWQGCFSKQNVTNPLLAKTFISQKIAESTMKAINTNLEKAMNLRSAGSYEALCEQMGATSTERLELAIDLIENPTIIHL